MGKFVCIEGIDGTGKSTQFEKLRERLGAAVKAISFPRYEDKSSLLLRAYLNGEYGDSPDAVNPYAASAFFAVDRLASYFTDWRDDYLHGKHILSYRYTTSNAVHQAAKLPGDEAIPFCDWLFDYEYNKLGLPAPCQVIYLDMSPDVTVALLSNRSARDIHETDDNYRRRCRESGLRVARHYGWHIIDCAPGGKLRTIEDIHDETYGIVRAFYNL